MDDEGTGFALADAVQAIRDELMAAGARGADQRLEFEVGDIQMEFTVELRKDTRVKAGIKAWVLSADADTGRALAHTHRVAFTLRPRDAVTGKAWHIANEDEGSTAGFTTPGR